jgi:FkbM family methyltransferase
MIAAEPEHVERTSDRLEFLAFCKGNRRLGHGQLLQDLWVLYETGFKTGGYFAEFGAADGIAHSNSLSLEQTFQWHGVLAEPNHSLSGALRSNRTVAIDTRCVWPTTGETVELLLADDPEFSTVASSAAPDMHTSQRLLSDRRQEVSTVSLDDLLDTHDAPDVVDYLSVDTEGTELAILSSFNFDRRDVRLITVEHNYRPDEALLDALLAAHGYERRFPEFSQWDAWYRKVAPR